MFSSSTKLNISLTWDWQKTTKKCQNTGFPLQFFSCIRIESKILYETNLLHPGFYTSLHQNFCESDVFASVQLYRQHFKSRSKALRLAKEGHLYLFPKWSTFLKQFFCWSNLKQADCFMGQERLKSSRKLLFVIISRSIET